MAVGFSTPSAYLEVSCSSSFFIIVEASVVDPGQRCIRVKDGSVFRNSVDPDPHR